MNRIGRRRRRFTPALVATFLCAMTAPAWAFLLPETEQKKCFQAVYPYAEIDCAGTGQDGAYTSHPLGYTDNGDGTVTDANTGLVWQQQDSGISCNWFRAAGVADAVYNPPDPQNTVVDICGSLTLGGHSDWRLPTKKELMSVVDYALPFPGPTIQAAYFPNTKGYFYWSATADASYTANSWNANFYSGSLASSHKSQKLYARCVRDGQSGGSPGQGDAALLQSNGNGTVTDSRTGLIWQQPDQPIMTWGAALSSCEQLALGGSSRWRLPNIKELASLTDETRFGPVFERVLFPNFRLNHYWSSTTYPGFPSSAWVLNFNYGQAVGSSKTFSLSARCVRGGEYGGSFGTLSLVVPEVGPPPKELPPYVDFYQVVPGTESLPRTFKVSNTGTAELTISGITKSGVNTDEFLLRNDLCTGVTLAPPPATGTCESGCSCTFDALFAPLDFGSKEATLFVTADADAAVFATLTGGLDSVPPTGSILVGNGALFTRTAAVTLNLSAIDPGGSGLDAMRFSNDAVAGWSAWEPFKATKAWRLAKGSGTKTVFVQFRDKYGNISDSNPATEGIQPYSDTIGFDPIAPTGTIRINNGAAETRTRGVNLNLSAVDTGGSGMLAMRLRNGGVAAWGAWEVYQETKAWVLTSGAGLKTVYAQFRDAAGNISDSDPVAAGRQPYSDTIQYTGP